MMVFYLPYEDYMRAVLHPLLRRLLFDDRDVQEMLSPVVFAQFQICASHYGAKNYQIQHPSLVRAEVSHNDQATNSLD